jgi:hypothetical protein
MKTVIAALALSLFATSAAHATAPVKKYTKTQQVDYKIMRQMNKTYDLGGATGNSQKVSFNKKTGEFTDAVYEGPGSPDPTIRGKVNVKTGEVTSSRIYNND